MKASEKSSRDSTSIEIAEALLAELRSRRKHLRQLIRMVHEQALRDHRVSEAPPRVEGRPRHKCKGAGASSRVAIAAQTSAASSA